MSTCVCLGEDLRAEGGAKIILSRYFVCFGKTPLGNLALVVPDVDLIWIYLKDPSDNVFWEKFIPA